ncbi:hypothetical protein WKI13_15270 [Teredinibacter turnerae]|uniref:hypothetical protein n=1 Tax=Teredinibacter turnerae TaxID=2426 RepID=UPI00037BB521|nr:hypothetical protein [Teredinibacter turnerae]
MNQNESQDSFIRWQAITISQLTYALNLILGLSVATLAFQVSLLLNKDFCPVSWQKITFPISMLLLLSSVAFGLWCVINRLKDFQITTKIARKRESGATKEELQTLRDFCTKLGKRTWGIFWCQIGTFGTGVFLTIISVGGSVAFKVM